MKDPLNVNLMMDLTVNEVYQFQKDINQISTGIADVHQYMDVWDREF